MTRALVIGAGHNGLACAIHLAAAGIDVLVLERAARPGGATTSSARPLPGLARRRRGRWLDTRAGRAALVRRAEREGARIRCDAEVEHVLVRRGRVRCVRLQNGEEIAADAVVSTLSAGPLAGMLDPGVLTALSAAAEAGALGRVPEHPALVVGQQSLHDPGRAPEGGHTLYVYAHVPSRYDIDDEEVVARIEAQLERFAPGFGALVLARATRSPRETGWRSARDERPRRRPRAAGRPAPTAVARALSATRRLRPAARREPRWNGCCERTSTDPRPGDDARACRACRACRAAARGGRRAGRLEGRP
jgi:phytoene dehydrogenase-like protein